MKVNFNTHHILTTRLLKQGYNMTNYVSISKVLVVIKIIFAEFNVSLNSILKIVYHCL